MAQKILVNLDMAGNAINSMSLEVLSSNPTALATGHTYYNSTADEVRTYNGSTWIASGGGTVDISGTPVALDFAKWTDADTIEGRSYAETRSDLSLEVGTDVQAWSAALDAVSGTNTGDEAASSSTVAGVVELATIAEVDTGTDTARAITPAGLAGSALQTKVDGIESSADVTDATNVASSGAVMADGTGNDITGDIVFTEKADHSSTPVATKGYLWTKNTVPTTLVFTDDAGTDTTLGAGDGDALTTGTLAQFAATTSAELAGVLSDETGTGLAVFGTSPTLITPLLGTPTSGVLTNTTGYPGDSSLTTVGTVTTGDVDAVVSAASATVAGKVELATIAETDTGTDATRAVTPAGLAGSALQTNADASKVITDFITVTQAVDLDTMETDIAALSDGMTYKGVWDASAGTFPGGGTAQTGAMYYVSVGGTVDSIVFDIGDNIVATTDNASTSTYAANWSKHDQTDAVASVAGKTGAVTLVKADVGLTSVDDTSDADKPVSTAQQTALDLKTAKYSETIGDAAATAIVVTHNLGTQDVIMSCREVSSDNAVICDMKATSTNTSTFTFATAPTSNEFRVTIIG